MACCSQQRIDARKDLEERRKRMPDLKDFWDAHEGILDVLDFLDLYKMDEKFLHELLKSTKEKPVYEYKDTPNGPLMK